MLKLKNILKCINEQKCIKQTWRLCATETQQKQSDTKQPVRERIYQSATVTYENHEHLLYSSVLENKITTINFTKQKRPQQKFPTDISFNDVMSELEAQYPKNWMEDYEFYEGAIDDEGVINSSHGTANANIAPSKVPCNGCGAHLHCANFSLPGFIPQEIFKGRTERELKTIVCQRCHFLKHYNIALDVEVTPDTYIDTISRIKDEFALALVIVDLLDFPCSIWPGLQKVLGSKRPIFVVGNKVDLLPRDSAGYLEQVKSCLQQQVVASGLDKLNLKYVSLISAKTGYGIEELITQLHKIWKYNGDVYLIGCTNVGKSSLFNILLNSDYCRPQASDLVRKATTTPWPGTTLQMLKFPIYRPSEIRIYQRFQRLFSERGKRAALEKLRRDQAKKTGSIKAAQLIGHVGRTFSNYEDIADVFSMSKGTQPIVTLDERSKIYQRARWCYDTPGVMHPAQITNLLTTEELLKLEPKEMITPRAVRLEPGMSLFLAGLARLDFIDCERFNEFNWIKVYVFNSLELPISITNTTGADQYYNENVGNELLGIPVGKSERLARWPGLQSNSENILKVEGINENGLSCDIVLSSAGWVGLQIPFDSICTFKAWTPAARGIYLRTPALITKADRLIGKRLRRNSLAYHIAKPFVFTK